MAEACDTCRFVHRRMTANPRKPAEVLECRRRPPKPDFTPWGGQTHGKWPQVWPEDWCGQWEPSEVKVEVR